MLMITFHICSRVMLNTLANNLHIHRGLQWVILNATLVVRFSLSSFRYERLRL